MRIFLYEHITGGGLCGRSLPPSLAAEGGAMLRALAEDLARLDGMSVAITSDERVEPPRLPGIEALRVSTDAEARRLFDTLAREADGTVVIAPELDCELVRLVRRVEEVGGRHLGSSAAAIEAASDKLTLPARLHRRGVKALPAVALDPEKNLGERLAFPLVVKPRYGAGSTGVVLIDSEAFLEGFELDPAREWIATSFTPGLAASALVLAGPQERLALAPCRQLLSEDGKFRYLGGELPLAPRLAARAARLALRAVEALPGLKGFVGVDLLLAEGEEEVQEIVEINPRLTTSYVGLRALAQGNLAATWLKVVSGEPAEAPAWRPGAVRFQPGGNVEEVVPW